MATDASPVVIETLAGGVMTLTLNRPERMNAFNAAVHEALAAAFTRAETDDGCRVVMITGSGKGFCAGQDLSERGVSPVGARPDLGAALEKIYNPLIKRMRALPKR